MRMHSYGKLSPNLIIGALLVFSIIVLYNYWSISALNHDLTLKIHSLEQQIISLSKTNDALQSNLEKVEEIKEKVELNLQKEQISEQQAKEESSQKDSAMKSLKNDLENAKQEAVNCKDEVNQVNLKHEKKEQEISELKENVVSLQAQIVEKDNKIARVEKDLEDFKQQLPKGISSGSIPTSAKPMKEVDKAGIVDDQPVLLLDQAEKEMKPVEGVVSPPGISPEQQPKHDKDRVANVGAEQGVMSVLAIPGEQQILLQQSNLDAQEDDGDRPLKDELIQQDDQSPDGDLLHKDPMENQGVVPAPALMKGQGNRKNGGLSAQQEEREAAHLKPGVDNFESNNNNL
ncbi:unnamed protein product [Orchesella dallaii]|uniref:Protein GOLM2 n=1 Tax=Orchesella dallaii TaxID=48710 RepID=A0ABP1S0F9_9HEXA